MAERTGTSGPVAGAVRPPRTLRSMAFVFFFLALALAIVGGVLGEVFFLRLGTEAMILAGLALSVDLLLGYTGLLSLGQAMYFGLGAYVSAVLLKDYGAGFWGALAGSLVLATPLGLIAGFAAIRSRGVYFILITFGFAQVASKLVYNTRELGGSDGMVGVPLISAGFGPLQVDLSDPMSFFLLAIGFIAVLYLLLAYLMNTPFGRTLVAIRYNEHRVRFLGFDPWRYKLAAYVIAANVAAVSGALYPMLRGFVSPELLFFEMSVNAVIMVILGGVGTLIGPMFGSAILVALQTVIGSWTEHHHIIVGLLFMLAVIFMPAGLAGYLRRRAEIRRGREGA